MAPTEQPESSAGGPHVHPVIDRLGATSWRLIGMGIVLVAAVWLLAQLWVVVLALVVAVLFSRALDPPAAWLRARRMPPALVAASVLLGFGLAMAGIVAALVPPISAEFEELGPTIDEAVDDAEDWLVEDSPFDVSRSDVREFRDDADQRLRDLLSDSASSGSLVSGTLLVFEVITALILALVTSFFILKDGARFGGWTVSLLPESRRPLVIRLAKRAWRTLGGYLRGSAALGLIEGTIIGLTVYLVGGSLAVPVAVITFFAAFVPFVGAVLAGATAVLVTLVSSGFAPALVVGIVALAVQQFDNDLLAPVVFGRALELHPLVVLFSLVAGSTLAGVFGALFAVPVGAVAVNVLAEARAAAHEGPAREGPEAREEREDEQAREGREESDGGPDG